MPRWKSLKNMMLTVGMSISAMSVVFCGLILLFIAFKIVGKVAVNLSKAQCYEI